jgi:hypothetical protein
MKPLHEMTEEELIAEVKTWNLDVFVEYVKDFYPEVATDLDFEDDL